MFSIYTQKIKKNPHLKHEQSYHPESELHGVCNA
jgi:hypothetical protein